SNPLGAFKQIFLLPAIYTILVGIIIQRLGLVLPDYVIQPVNLLGEAAIPNSILLLGAQLARIKFNQDLKPTLIASFMRLILSAMIAFLLTLLFKFDGITQKVLILLPAMPSAVYSVILATKFDVRPEFPSGVILVSTIASAFTLAILLFMLS
ncbi:AEC family transporter, partial [candidate division KSB1 bacterium]|nr:AEC family transporter [candidate division KSB1 bacterium]